MAAHEASDVRPAMISGKKETGRQLSFMGGSLLCVATAIDPTRR